MKKSKRILIVLVLSIFYTLIMISSAIFKPTEIREPQNLEEKGENIYIYSEDVYKKLDNFKVYTGDIVYINDFVGKEETDLTRANVASLLKYAISQSDENEAEVNSLKYEDNYSFIYSGEETYIFEFIEKKYDQNQVPIWCFYVHTI